MKKIIIIVSLVLIWLLSGIFGVTALVKIFNKGQETMKLNMSDSQVEQNTILLSSVVSETLNEYDDNDQSVIDIEDHIANGVNNGYTNGLLKNPVTKKSGAYPKSLISKGGAVIYSPSDNTYEIINGFTEWPFTYSKAAGMVAFGAYINPITDKIEVKIIPYDIKGNIMYDKVEVISK